MSCADASSPPRAAPHIGTLGKRFVPFYLTVSENSFQHADLLDSLFAKRKNGRVKSALWDGHCSLRKQGYHYTESLRNFGGLLFFGQPKAIAVANAMEQERRQAEEAKRRLLQQAKAPA